MIKSKKSMARKRRSGISYSYHKSEAEKWAEEKASRVKPRRKKISGTGFKFPMGGFIVVDKEGNIYIGKQDKWSKSVEVKCMIESDGKMSA